MINVAPAAQTNLPALRNPAKNNKSRHQKVRIVTKGPRAQEPVEIEIQTITRVFRCSEALPHQTSRSHARRATPCHRTYRGLADDLISTHDFDPTSTTARFTQNEAPKRFE